MRSSSRNAARGAAILALGGSLGLAALRGATGCRTEEPTPASGGGGSGDAGTGGAKPDADASECPPPSTLFVPDGVPAGWVRPPCAPEACMVFVSPDAEHMNAASPWTSCGDGCVELVEDWPGGGDGGPGAARFLAPLGAAEGGVRYLGYGRNYGVHGYAPFELQIVRLPDNVVTFDAYMPEGIDGNSACNMHLQAVGTDRSLGRLGLFNNNGAADDPELTYELVPDAAPRVLRYGLFPWPAETVLTPSLWAVVPESLAWIAWHDFERSDQMQPLWTSPDGRWAHSLAAHGSTVFFSTLVSGAMYQLEVADPDAGSRVLRAFPNAAEGGACCARTDGTSLVWLEGSGLFDPPTRSYSAVRMMRSAYATTASALAPETVRLLTLQNTVDGANMIMGPGYVLQLEVRNVGGTLQKTLALTHVATGRYWDIPPDPGRAWTQLLYVDAEEFAVTDQGGTLGEGRLVRRSVASLGKPMPPKLTP